MMDYDDMSEVDEPKMDAVGGGGGGGGGMCPIASTIYLFTFSVADI